jgi:ADP-heptose:LPS heptosyltransferase
MEVPQSVAVFRALQLGDLLCAVPAFRALRAALPRARIGLVGLPWARTFVERFNRYFDDFWEFPGYPGLPEQPPAVADLPAFLAAIHGQRLDLAIQMHGCGTITNPLVAMLGARRSAGYYVPGNYCPEPERFLPYPERLPEVWKHLRLMEFLCFEPRGEHLEFPLFEHDMHALDLLLEETGLMRGQFVCVHPGARASARCWAPAYFAAVADALAKRGWSIALTGTGGEAPLTRAVAECMHAGCVDLAGRTDLGTLAALLDASALLICNDTGVSHVAAALGAPSVVVFHQLSELEGWPPRDRQRHRVVASLTHVTPEMVLDEADDLLRWRAGSVSDRCSGATPPVTCGPGSPKDQEEPTCVS